MWELHERIRVHSMEASRRVKQGDGINDLMDRIAGDPAFGVTAEDIARRFSQVGEAPAEKGERESHD